MPKQLTRLTVFVSGTAEIEAEKAALKRVLEDLSSVTEKTHGITLRIAVFPDTIRPGVSTDPQAEFNTQNAEYDIYVGLLGARFGTPTPRAGSGTEEEFEDALARFHHDRRAVRVMFYFKRADQDPFTVDLKQLQRVMEFREGLPSRGVLYRDFKDTPGFIDIIRSNLHHLIIDEWDGSFWRDASLTSRAITAEFSETATGDKPATSEDTTPVTEQAETGTTSADAMASGDTVSELRDLEADDDDLGYLELAEEFERRVESQTNTLGRISRHTRHIGEQFQVRTKETELLTEQLKKVENVGGSRTRQDHLASAKNLVNLAGDDLERYSAEMGTDILTFREDAHAMVSTLRRLLISQKELASPAEKKAESRDAITSLVETLTGTRDQVTTFQTAVARVPAMTGRFKRARKKVTAMLGEFLVEIQFLVVEGKKIQCEIDGN